MLRPHGVGAVKDPHAACRLEPAGPVSQHIHQAVFERLVAGVA